MGVCVCVLMMIVFLNTVIEDMLSLLPSIFILVCSAQDLRI